MTDPIADFLTRIRNAVKANHKVVEAPGSKIKQEITKILFEQGYILAYKFDNNEPVSYTHLEKFFDDPDSITPDELLAAIRKATMSMQIVPMLCGSSFHNKGVQKLLDYIMAFLPSPLDLPPVTGINPKTDEEVERRASEDDPFCGLAFKIATDPFVGRLAFVRIYSGKLDAGSYVLLSLIHI